MPYGRDQILIRFTEWSSEAKSSNNEANMKAKSNHGIKNPQKKRKTQALEKTTQPQDCTKIA